MEARIFFFFFYGKSWHCSALSDPCLGVEKPVEQQTPKAAASKNQDPQLIQSEQILFFQRLGIFPSCWVSGMRLDLGALGQLKDIFTHGKKK